VIEVQVRQHDHVDVLGSDAERAERFEEDVALLHDAVTGAKRGLEERPDASLAQYDPVVRAHDQAAASERDPVLRVGANPALPHRFRGVTEHRATVEPLRVALR
jgi:hypothetical protein